MLHINDDIQCHLASPYNKSEKLFSKLYTIDL